ncbi:MAG: tRNA (adenine(22)-N(1))-methyltransferase TrmK [Bacilli bacterium]
MISNRLQAIASFIPPAKKIVDVGCDHGYLIIEAFEKYQIDFAVALDNKQGPLSKAIDNIRGYDFFEKVNFILSDGLNQFYAKADAFIFAGMGGLTIIDIIKRGIEKISDASLIIQANRHTPEVRTFLSRMGYGIVNEQLVFEDGKYYEICLFKKSQGIVSYNENEILFGPIFLLKKEEIFFNKLRNDLRILKEIPYQTKKNVDLIKRIEEILCL